MSGNPKPPDQLSIQELEDSFLEESRLLQAASRKHSAISPTEVDAMMQLVEKLQREAEKGEKASTEPPLSLFLEVKESKGAKPLLIPAKLKNLYQGMVVLEVHDLESITNPETLRGKQAILRLTDPVSQETMDIDGTMTWTQSLPDRKISLNLKTQNVQTSKPASKILENSLPTASKDTKMLWNLWDETQETRETDSSDKKANYILLLMAGGAIATSIVEPRLMGTMHNLLGIAGINKFLNLFRRK